MIFDLKITCIGGDGITGVTTAGAKGGHGYALDTDPPPAYTHCHVSEPTPGYLTNRTGASSLMLMQHRPPREATIHYGR